MVHNHIRIDGPPLWTELLGACQGWIYRGMLALDSVGADGHNIWTPENFPSAQGRTACPRASLRLGSAHTTRPHRVLLGQDLRHSPLPGSQQRLRMGPGPLSTWTHPVLLPSESVASQYWDLGGPGPFLVKSIEKNPFCMNLMRPCTQLHKYGTHMNMGAGRMAHWVKHLSHKHKDLSTIPRTHTKLQV